MPTLMAAIESRSGSSARDPASISRERAWWRATHAPQIDAQRVPPSAWRTSQSSHTVRSPRASRSTTARSERPIRRWISVVRPSGRPLATSRGFRSPVDPGSIPYSAVTQPRPRPRIQGGTASSTEAVQITRVRPTEIRALPCGRLDEAREDLQRAELVRRASVGSHPGQVSTLARMPRTHRQTTWPRPWRRRSTRSS